MVSSANRSRHIKCFSEAGASSGKEYKRLIFVGPRFLSFERIVLVFFFFFNSIILINYSSFVEHPDSHVTEIRRKIASRRASFLLILDPLHGPNLFLGSADSHLSMGIRIGPRTLLSWGGRSIEKE